MLHVLWSYLGYCIAVAYTILLVVVALLSFFSGRLTRTTQGYRGSGEVALTDLPQSGSGVRKSTRILSENSKNDDVKD